MTPRRAARDVPASVRQRLLNLARAQGGDFEAVLRRYAIERFLIEQPNGGLRVRIRGSLGRVRLAVPVDIGFGDVMILGRRGGELPDAPRPARSPPLEVSA